MTFIKLETTGEDSYGPIYEYVNIELIVSISKFKDLTNVYLTNGRHIVVKESPSTIFNHLEYCTDVI